MSDQKGFTYIASLQPNMKQVNVQFIVLDVGPARRTKDGNDIRTVRVADKSGSINFAVWNELGSYLKGSDICRLLNGYTSVHKNSLGLNCGKMGDLQKIGEFCMLFSEVPFMSQPNPELAKYSTDYGRPSGGEGNGGSGNGGSTTQTQSTKAATR